MQRISQLLRILEKRVKQELHIPDKPFLELVAFYLPDIFKGFLSIYFVAMLFESLFLFEANSQAGVTQVVAYSMIFYGSLMFFSFGFCFFSNWEIIPKIEKFDSLTKYKFLMFRGAITKVFNFLLLLSVSSLLFVFLQTDISNILKSSLVMLQINGFIVGLTMGLFSFMFPFTLVQINKKEVETSNFALFEDFEILGKYYNEQILGVSKTHVLALKFLMNQIVNRTEKAVNQCLDIYEDFPTEFYRPFTTISLAAILGNIIENQKAKAWVGELGNIIMDSRIDDSSKTKLILNHLSEVDNDENLKNFRKIQDKFGFQYSFEHNRKRLNGTGQMFVSIFTIIGSIVAICEFVLIIYQTFITKMTI